MKTLLGNCQNVTLLYFLFIATLIHLGYFVINQETQSIVIFSLAFLFIYLIDTNMIFVLGISLLFVDILYIIQRMPEGFTSKKDISGIDISDSDMDLSGNSENTEPMTNKDKSKNKGKNKNKGNKENFDDAVNPLVEASETIGREKMEGRELKDIQEDSKTMKSVLDKIKGSPEIVDSLKTLNGIDINELNKLINNLNTVVDSFSV